MMPALPPMLLLLALLSGCSAPGFGPHALPDCSAVTLSWHTEMAANRAPACAFHAGWKAE